jgi:hypothetical protein
MRLLSKFMKSNAILRMKGSLNAEKGENYLPESGVVSTGLAHLFMFSSNPVMASFLGTPCETR